MRQRGPFAGHTKARPGLSLSRLATCSLPFNSKLKLETSIAAAYTYEAKNQWVRTGKG
jgi:hypothetical protein